MAATSAAGAVAAVGVNRKQCHHHHVHCIRQILLEVWVAAVVGAAVEEVAASFYQSCFFTFKIASCLRSTRGLHNLETPVFPLEGAHRF